MQLGGCDRTEMQVGRDSDTTSMQVGRDCDRTEMQVGVVTEQKCM